MMDFSTTCTEVLYEKYHVVFFLDYDVLKDC